MTTHLTIKNMPKITEFDQSIEKLTFSFKTAALSLSLLYEGVFLHLEKSNTCLIEETCFGVSEHPSCS